MATIKQRLALSFINFLNTSLVDGTLSEEDRESVEVAQTCISDIFKVESPESAPKDSESLLQIYSVYEKLKSKTPNQTSKDTATPVATSSPADNQKEAEKLKSQGNTSMANKEYDTAIDLYTKALSLVPGNPIFLSNRAAAYSASKDHEAARADAEAAVAADPTYTKAWSRLGFARFALGDAKGSKEAYAKGIEYEGNGGSEAMKKGFETASRRVADLESDEKSEANDTVADRATSNDSSGGMPDLSSLAGMFGRGGGSGMPDLSSIMSNPMFASMAQNLMSNPEMLGNLMNNPRLAELAGQVGGSGGGGGGSPNLSSILQDPNLAEMAKKFLGGAGRGNGQ